MKKLINFLKKLFGCKQVCPKCKSNPCKCEMEVPAEHKIELSESVAVEPVKWEGAITAPIDAAGLNQNYCCKVESAPAKKKRVRKKKVVPVVVDQEIPAEEPEVPVVEISAPVEVSAEKIAEPKKKRSRKKKTESK